MISGWAAAILFNPTVRAQFDAFRARSDTFSLGVCNGCQLMALLGWVAPADVSQQTANQNGGKMAFLVKLDSYSNSKTTECLIKLLLF